MKKGPNVRDVSKEDLERWYWGDDNTSIQDIANRLGVSREAVRRWFKHFEIPIKPKGTLGFKKMVNPQLKNRDWLSAEIQEKTGRQIAQELEVSDDVVSYWLKKHGLRQGNETKSQAIKESLRKLYPDGRTGSQSGRWKGGRRVTRHGYIRAYAPDHPFASNGTVFEHRLVMEKKLGRYLEPDEIVHHLDGDKSNNAEDNLELKGNGQHISEHFQASHEVTAMRKRMKELEEENKFLKAELEKFRQGQNEH